MCPSKCVIWGSTWFWAVPLLLMLSLITWWKGCPLDFSFEQDHPSSIVNKWFVQRWLQMAQILSFPTFYSLIWLPSIYDFFLNLFLLSVQFQFSSVTQSCLTLYDPMNHSTPGLPVHLPESTQTHVHWVGDTIQPSHPLSSPPPPAPSIRVFCNESTLCMRWPNYWSFSFSLSPSNEHPGLISFMMDWLDLLAGQETLKSLLQHHSSKASVLPHSAFFTV